MSAPIPSLDQYKTKFNTICLGADQMFKHQSNTKWSNNTELNIVHLDEVNTSSDIKLAIDSCKSTTASFSIIVYVSPQYLVTKETGLSAFLKFLLGHPHLLSMIVIDEIHLLTDFGRSFRREFQMLKDELFQKVEDTKPMLFLMHRDMYDVDSHIFWKFD